MHVHHLAAGLLQHDLERQVVAEPPHDSLGDSLARPEGGQAAQSFANPRVGRVGFDVHEGQLVATARRRESIVEANARYGDLDRFTSRDRHGMRDRVPTRRDGPQPGDGLALERAECALAIGHGTEPDALKAPAAAGATGPLGDLACRHESWRDDHVQSSLRVVLDRHPDLILAVAAGHDSQVARLARLEDVNGFGHDLDRRSRRLRTDRGRWLGRRERPAQEQHSTQKARGREGPDQTKVSPLHCACPFLDGADAGGSIHPADPSQARVADITVEEDPIPSPRTSATSFHSVQTKRCVSIFETHHLLVFGRRPSDHSVEFAKSPICAIPSERRAESPRSVPGVESERSFDSRLSSALLSRSRPGHNSRESV